MRTRYQTLLAQGYSLDEAITAADVLTRINQPNIDHRIAFLTERHLRRCCPVTPYWYTGKPGEGARP